MYVKIWDNNKEKYLTFRAVNHIYNDTILRVGDILKLAFAIEINEKKQYFDKEAYTLDFIHNDID